MMDFFEKEFKLESFPRLLTEEERHWIRQVHNRKMSPGSATFFWTTSFFNNVEGIVFPSFFG